MAYTETTTTGYGTRVGRSFKGILSGLFLFIAATALLWWNEGRVVKTDKMLDEAEKVCIDMENPSKISQEFEGELVCATAMATTDAVLNDDMFGLSENAIGLQRRVEYFQWVEHEHSESEDKLGGKEVTTTTYTYTQEWCDRPIDSGQFKDPAYQGRNFIIAAYENQELWAEDVSFGAYKLNESLIHRISSREPIVLALNEEMLATMDKAARDILVRTGVVTPQLAAPRISHQPAPATNPIQSSPAMAQADTTAAAADSTLAAVPDSVKTVVPDSIPQDNKVDLEYVHQQGNVLYLGRTSAAPQVGDVRITFEKITPAKVTVIAEVTGDTFKPYKAKNGKRFQTLVMGKKDADEIFDAEHEANHFWMWVLRIVGILLVISGLKGIFGFLEMILKVVPFVANIIGWGVGVVCTIVGIAWSLIVIGIAWLFYRPLIGIALLAVAGALIWIFAFKGKDKLKELARRSTNAAPEVTPQAS